MTDSKITDELLPCPFCGGTKPQLHTNALANMSWVACIECGMEAPSETGTSADDAARYWNTRHQEPVNEPSWFAVQSVTGTHIGMWRNETIARRVFNEEYPDGRFIPLYAAPLPAPVVTDEMVETLYTAIEAHIRTVPLSYGIEPQLTNRLRSVIRIGLHAHSAAMGIDARNLRAARAALRGSTHE